MKKLFSFSLFACIAFFGILTTSVSAAWDTTDSNKFARHNYTITNTGSCRANWTVTLDYGTTGETFFYSENVQRSGTFESGQTLSIGYVEFRTYQCQAGTGTSSIVVTSTSHCGTATDTVGYTSEFFNNCGNKVCHDANGDTIPDECRVNGNTTISCNTLSDCPPVIPQPEQKYCHDSNNDHIADQCKLSGNLHIACNNLSDCPTGDTFYFCTDSNQCSSGQFTDEMWCEMQTGKNCYDSQSSCTANAVADCGNPSQKYCHDTNGDGTSDQCKLGGNTGIACNNLNDCPTLQTFYFCTGASQCASGEFVSASACQAQTGKPCYTTQSACQARAAIDCPNIGTNKCADTNNDGTFDACNVSGTGPTCNNVNECLQVRACNENNQCVIGGTGASCSTNADCAAPVSRCNANNQCTTNGTGILCSTNADCSNQPRCNNNNQCTVGGTGIPCSTAADCSAQPRCNESNQCVIGGTGDICSTNADCRPVQPPRCNDSNNDGIYDSCNQQGGGPVCDNFEEDCRQPGCDGNQCVTGGVGRNCANDSDCRGGGGTSCSALCTQEGATCSDGTRCMNVSGTLRCANPSCPSDSDCQCGGGGSSACNDSNNDGRYDECVRGGTGPSCVTASDCNNGGGGSPSCNALCTLAGSTCSDGSTCMNIGGTLRCRNTQCSNRIDCSCNTGDGGSNYCGDGIIQRPNDRGQIEECDDGNNVDDKNGCTADCRLRYIPPQIGKSCQSCGCIEKNVSVPLAGDKQTVTYTLTISNKSRLSGTQVEPYEIKVFDTIFQKKKFKENNPLKGPETFVSSEGYIEFPDKVCIAENVGNVVVKNAQGQTPDAQGCFAFKPGVNIGNVTDIPGNSAPVFYVTSLQPGDYVILKYDGVARTTFPGHEFQPETQFIDITNEVRTQTNNDYASLTVSKPYIITSNSGDVILNGESLESVNVSNLVPFFGLDPDLYKNIAGLILSPSQFISSLTSYLGELNTYFSAENGSFGNQIEQNITNVTRNMTPSQTNMVRSENDFSLLGQRPDGQRVFTADNGLTVQFDTLAQVQNSSLIVVKKGDLIIKSNILYGNPLAGSSRLPSLAFVVLEGDIIIDPNVTRLDGLYIVRNSDFKLTGGASALQLVFNGAVFGNMKELLAQRTFVGLPEENGGSIVVNYDARILSSTPPGLKDIVGNIVFEQIVK